MHRKLKSHRSRRQQSRRRRKSVSKAFQAVVLEGLGLFALLALFLTIRTAPDDSLKRLSLVANTQNGQVATSVDEAAPGPLKTLRDVVEKFSRDVFRGS